MCLLQLNALADNTWFWMKEWAWNYTNLSHYNDSSVRICFSFLLHLFSFFFFYYPTLCSDDRVVMENRQKLVLGASVSKLDAGSLGLMVIHWWSSATNSSMCKSEQVIFWVRGDKTIWWHYYSFLWFFTSCSEVWIFGSFSCLRCHSLVPGQYEPWCPWKERNFLHSSQPWGKVIIDLVLAFPTGVDELCCRCFCCLGWLKDRFHCHSHSTVKQIIAQTEGSFVITFDNNVKICISYYWLTSMTMEGYWWNKNWPITPRQVAMEEKGLVCLVFYELLQMQYVLPTHRYYCQAA